jgi:hypothetical protein
MPAVSFSVSFMVSRLRSSISFSVTTVTDCGMSRSSCLPLPICVSVACRPSLPSDSLAALALTVGSALSAVAAAV